MVSIDQKEKSSRLMESWPLGRVKMVANDLKLVFLCLKLQAPIPLFTHRYGRTTTGMASYEMSKTCLDHLRLVLETRSQQAEFLTSSTFEEQV